MGAILGNPHTITNAQRRRSNIGSPNGADTLHCQKACDYSLGYELTNLHTYIAL